MGSARGVDAAVLYRRRQIPRARIPSAMVPLQRQRAPGVVSRFRSHDEETGGSQRAHDIRPDPGRGRRPCPRRDRRRSTRPADSRGDADHAGSDQPAARRAGAFIHSLGRVTLCSARNRSVRGVFTESEERGRVIRDVVEERPRRALVVSRHRGAAASLERCLDHVLVRDNRGASARSVEARAALVVALDHVPGRLRDVGVHEHLILRVGEVHPARPLTRGRSVRASSWALGSSRPRAEAPPPAPRH